MSSSTLWASGTSSPELTGTTTWTSCGTRLYQVIFTWKGLNYNESKRLLSHKYFFILPSGKEHNFKTRDDSVSSALGVPYDYGSVMHYSKSSFNVASDPTIVTKIPKFMDVIGQRMGFSASDLTKLNHLYNCSESSQPFLRFIKHYIILR